MRVVDPETRESESRCVSEVEEEAWRFFFWFLSFCASDLLLRSQDRFSLFLSSGLSLQNAFVFWKRFFNDFLEFFFFQRFSLTVATVLALTFLPTKQRITFSGFLSNWVFCNFFFFFFVGGLDHVCSWRSRWWSSFDYGAPKRWWDCVLYHKGWLQVSFFFINFHNFSYPLLCSYWFLWKLLLLL